MAAWIPANFEDACRRNAGRRKLHMRKRKDRSERIIRLLTAMQAAPVLSDSAYGWLAVASEVFGTSKATTSRDFALARRINRQFVRMFGRNFDSKKDGIIWTWNWAHYGFITTESRKAGYPEPVGHFPFDTRRQETEEDYCDFTQLSWQNEDFISKMSTRELMRALDWSVNRLVPQHR